MRLSEAPPVQLTGLDAAERAISVCMETEIVSLFSAFSHSISSLIIPGSLSADDRG